MYVWIRPARGLRQMGALLLAMALACGVSAATYYVDSAAGNDSASGTSTQSAWRSLGKVNGFSFAPGDSVLFKAGGSWKGQLIPKTSGQAGKFITFGRYGSTESYPCLDANGASETVLLKNVEYIVIENLEITNPASNPERRARGVMLHNELNRPLGQIIIRNNYIHDVIGAAALPTRAYCGAIYIYTKYDKSRYDDLLIEGNLITQCSIRGISGDQGVTNWEHPDNMHRRTVIRGNTIRDIGADGIRLIAMNGALVEHNVVDGCGAFTRGQNPGYIAACFPQQCKDTTWQFNEVARTAHGDVPSGDEDGQAFDIDWGCAGTHIFQYNYTHDNHGGFFLFMGKMVGDHEAKIGPFTAAIIRYNISQNDGIREDFIRLFEVHGFGGRTFPIHVYNNTFYNDAEMGMHLKGNDFKGLAFYNNIFVSPKGNYNTRAVYDNNLYWGHSAPAGDARAVLANPKLLAPGSGGEGLDSVNGYKLQPTSPARKAGKAIDDNGGRDYWGNPLPASQPDIGAHQVSSAAVSIRARAVFYNRSAFDGYDAGPGLADDAAVAPDKQALLPGQKASFANYTSYSRGINGLMIDVANIADTPTADDFEFLTGNSGSLSTWKPGPTPLSITLRRGAGLEDSDRVTLIFADNVICNTWLRVRLKASPRTGLAGDDVFYFGNAIGETGNSDADAMVTAADAVGIRGHQIGPLQPPATLENVYDINRDRLVTASDAVLVRTYTTNLFSSLMLITAP